MGSMMQAMVLVGILAICAASGLLLTYRHRWAPDPDEPTGSYAAPTPPVPSPPPATAAPGPAPVPAAPGSRPAASAPSATALPPAAAGVPVKPSQPLPAAPADASPVAAARLGRNSGFNRFAPAPVRRITPGVYR
ncbi:hypothetical protein [Actinoplanes sp. NPDC049599]|uniref:hypothetical protein n=1 Tax=Actinoplanes sp. NPDC049599 TaxID=3363903 RepID=UPI0037A0D158